MSITDDFFKKYPDPIDGKEVPIEVIKKHENILPSPIIDLWKKHGFGGYAKGLYWTINPDEYKGYLNKWINIEWEDTYPIMRTAFGDIIVIYCIQKEDEEYERVGFDAIDLRHQEGDNITIGLEDFFKNYLLDNGRFMSRTNIEVIMFYNIVNSLGTLKSDQCYGFEPILALGGKEKEKNMKIFNFKVHLDILTQSLKEPIDL